MTGTPKKGDKVRWQTSQGETSGTVEKIVTATTQVKRHIAKATEAEPQVLVKSDKTRKQAVHKSESLKKA